MNRKQALAIILIVIAIFFSLTSLLFSLTLLKADTSGPQTIEDNVSLGYGVIQLTIEPQGGRGDSNEEEHSR
jgi:hypothetical protein